MRRLALNHDYDSCIPDHGELTVTKIIEDA